MNSKIWLLGIALCLVFSFSACKQKQSAYKAAYEKAKEKEPQETVVVVEELEPVSKPKVESTTPKSVEAPVIKKEKVTTVAGSGLKRFSVVIGSFQNKTNAVSLQERMQSEGFNVILAQNESQMYRVIVASYDQKESAVSKREEIKKQFAPSFQDAWILEQQY